MRSLTWKALGLSGVLLLGMAVGSDGAEGGAKAEPVLEIMSLDQGACTLGLSYSWGAMAVNHVMFNDHRGPFKAVVESSGKGVRVTFDGWGDGPFVASAEKIRIIYWVAGRKEMDFAAEAMPGGAVRIRAVDIRAVDRQAIQGRRIVIRLGEPAAKGAAIVSVEGRKD
jgi:hypothetical protein